MVLHHALATGQGTFNQAAAHLDTSNRTGLGSGVTGVPLSFPADEEAGAKGFSALAKAVKTSSSSSSSTTGFEVTSSSSLQSSSRTSPSRDSASRSTPTGVGQVSQCARQAELPLTSEAEEHVQEPLIVR